MANNYTTFPDSVQTFELKTDVSSNVYSAWVQFNTYMTRGEFANATELLQSNSELQKCIIDSGYMNKLSKTIEEVQTLFLNDIQTYIHETIIDKGEWNNTTKYVKYNFVSYPVNGIVQTFECLRDDTPIATLPTNTTYWVSRVIQGEKGDSGTGLTPKGIWNSLSVYLEHDFVAYGNSFWQCLNQNSNSIPTNENTNWLKLMDLNDELNNAINISITEALTDYALKSEIPTIPSSLPANGGNANTVNNHTVESNVPTNAKFTDTTYTHPTTHPASMITGLPTSLPANGGNSATVGGYKVRVMTQAAYDGLADKSGIIFTY